MTDTLWPEFWPATQADIDVMAAIHASAFPAGEAWSRDVFDLQLRMPNVFSFIHRHGGLILARTAADEAEILTLAVVPEQRRAGIACQLLCEATNRAASSGASTLFLEVSVANAAARGLYVKAGFREAGLRRHYYADNTDALVMRLNITGLS